MPETSNTADLERAFATLFPSAPTRRPLQLRRPPIGILVARRWHAAGVVLLLTGAYLLVMLQLLAPGGTIVGFGVRWFLLALAIFVAGAVTWLGAATRLRRQAPLEPTTWEQWAASRGFRATRTPRAGDGRLDITPSRDYGSTFTGRAGSHQVVVGNCYVHGPYGTERNVGLGLVAARVQLRPAVTERLPSSHLDRFLVGRHSIRAAGRRDLRELRLESIALDDSCELRVDAGSDGADWFTLLDPEMVDGLGRDGPVSWIQQGDRLVVFAPAPIGTLDGAQIDSVCNAATRIASRFDEVAGQVAPLDATEAASADRRAARHRLRHRVLDALTIVGCLLLFAIPIAVTATLDERSDRARAERQERDQDRFATRFTANRVADAVLSCAILQRASAGLPGAPPTPTPTETARDCIELPREERDRVLATSLVDVARLDAVDIRADADVITVSATSDDGVTYRVDVSADSLEQLERTCTPAGEGCRDGRWTAGG